MVDVKFVENMLRRLSDSRSVSFKDFVVDKDFGFFTVADVVEEDALYVDVLLKNISDSSLSNDGCYIYNDFLCEFNELMVFDGYNINDDFIEFIYENYYEYILKLINDCYSSFVNSYLSNYSLNKSIVINLKVSDFFNDFNEKN